MTNRKIPLFLIVLAVAGLILYSPTVRSFFSAFSQTLQSAVLHTKKAIETGIERHIEQAETINRLHTRNRELEWQMIRCKSDAANFRAIASALRLSEDFNATLEAAHARGYARLGNFQQLWLDDFESYNPLVNYGVIRDGFAIGIVVEKRRQPLMILAGDKECNFAVYINMGDERAPGIATGLDARHMVVKYIPEWMSVRRGHEVFTSGLDHIFPAGVPVGRVLSVKRMQGFKNAKIQLYGDTLHPEFVWVSKP
jgi:rod shape-determining protein MreC